MPSRYGLPGSLYLIPFYCLQYLKKTIVCLKLAFIDLNANFIQLSCLCNTF